MPQFERTFLKSSNEGQGVAHYNLPYKKGGGGDARVFPLPKSATDMQTIVCAISISQYVNKSCGLMIIYNL